MKNYFVFPLLLVFFSQSAIAQLDRFERNQKIDQALQELIKESESRSKNNKKLSPPIPGMVAGFIRQGEPLQVGAAGLRKYQDDTLITPSDLIHIGSCTKAMTATLIGILVDQGKLKFDTTIAQGLPHLLDKIHEDYHDVTLHQLLTHTAGVPRDTFWSDYADKKVSERRDLLIANALQDKPKFPRGAKFAYSNLGYTIAGRIAAYHEKTTWEELIERLLFQKLSMASASFGPPGTKNQIDQPWGHIALGKKLIPRQLDNPPPLGPAGTVHLNIKDWAKFAFVHAGISDVKIVSDETLKKLHNSQNVKIPNNNYACGWIVDQRQWANGKVLTHSGSNNMWFATIWIAPKSKSIYIAAANAGPAEIVTNSVDNAIGSLIKLSKQ